jgi:hypothetical protein
MKKVQNSAQQGVRIWPLDRLIVNTSRSSAYTSIIATYPNRTCDPLSLICISNNIDKGAIKVYIFICLYVYIYIYIFIYLYVYIHIYKYIYIYIYTYN